MYCLDINDHLIIAKRVTFARLYSQFETGKHYMQINFMNGSTITLEYDFEEHQREDYSRLKHSISLA